MSETIKQSELRNNNAVIMRRVAEGESFTVTVHGQPVADPVPISGTQAEGGASCPRPSSTRLLANVVRQAGRNSRPRRMELLIAATAVRHGFSLATRNAADLRHVERVLTIIDMH